MADRPRTSSGLANRVVRASLVVGIATVFTAGVISLVNTSDLASERAAARDLVALQLVEGAIDERLRAADSVIERASGLVSTSRNETELAATVTPLFTGSRALFDELTVVEVGTARVLVGVPERPSRSQVRRMPAYVDAVKGSSGLMSYRDDDDVLQVWITRTTVTPWRTPVVVLARMSDGFLRRALERAVRDRPDRLILLVEEGEVAAVAGGTSSPLSETVVWAPGVEGLGEVDLVLEDGIRYAGYYNDIEAATGINWRIVAAEPSTSDVGDTIRAVAPSLAVLVLGGSVALALAWSVTNQLVRPLRDLERTARTAASGAYVKPLPATSDDEIGRVSQAFNQVALRLNALHDLSQLLASASRLDQVLDGILSAMGHIVGPGATAVYLLDAEARRLVPVRTRGIGMASVRPVPVAAGGWLVEALWGSGPVTITGSPERMAEELPGLTSAATAALAAPLVAGHEALGLVVMLRDGLGESSEAEREMLRTFSAQAAVAVQTSRLFEVESESRHMAEALRAVAEELVRPETLHTALGTVEDIISNLFGASVARIVIVDRAILGLPPAEDHEGDAALLGTALRCLETGGGAAVVRHGMDAGADEILTAGRAHELIVVPIALESDHGAVLMVALPDHADTASVEVARALADELALALDNSYFYERAVNRAANLETIFRISQAVASSLQVNVVLNRVLDVVQKILSAEAVMLWSYDSRRRALGTAMVRGDVPAHMVQLELGPGEDLPGHVFQSGQPVSIRDLSVGMGGVAGSAALQNLKSLLAVPLLARGRPVGVLMVLSSVAGAFSDEDLNMLQTFASQAALAIDTARLYSREHEVAHVLQQSILPKALPEFAEVDAGSVYAPAGGEADIGGDYYDLFRGPDSAVWFTIADVCGKGVQAATKTSMIKYALRAFVAAGLSPAAIASEINRMTAEAGDASEIVTLWVGRYDIDEAKLVWADGGHPAAVLRRADGAILRLGPTGPLLGALADVEYEQETVDFGPGDRILLYTDGVTEARQGNTFFGETRVTEALTGDLGVQEIAGRLLESVKAFASGELRDDVAILVLEARAETKSDSDKGAAAI